jgi:hypothetical protein
MRCDSSVIDNFSGRPWRFLHLSSSAWPDRSVGVVTAADPRFLKAVIPYIRRKRTWGEISVPHSLVEAGSDSGTKAKFLQGEHGCSMIRQRRRAFRRRLWRESLWLR